jgi:fimbrial chaperone protein
MSQKVDSYLLKKLTVILSGILFLLPYLAMAGSFTVIPIKVYLEKEKKTATIRVRNNAQEKVTVQVRAVEWRQDEEGRDKFTSTKEIIFFPKIFTIEPDEERVVRIGYQGEWPLREKTYRIFLRELPVEKPGGTALKMALRIGMPLFISPTNKIEKVEIEKVSIEEIKPPEEKKVEPASPKTMLVVRVKNSGNVHLSLKKIKATGLDESGGEVFSKEVTGWYVLAGRSRPFAIEISPEEFQNSRVIKVRVETKTSCVDAELEVDRAIPGR